MKNSILSWLIKSPERFFFLAFIFCLFALIILDFTLEFNTKEDWKGVLTEAHGMLLDIIVFGIVLSIYEKYRDLKKEKEKEKLILRQEILRYQEEINDFRLWESEEAKIRLQGNIKRLQNLGVEKINLVDCYLYRSSYDKLIIKNSDLKRANFSLSFLKNALFANNEMNGIKMIESGFGINYLAEEKRNQLTDEEFYSLCEKEAVRFVDCILWGANFHKSTHRNTLFNGSHLGDANFSECVLINVHFEGAILIDKIDDYELKANFKGAHLINCTASKSQKNDLIECGAKVDMVKFIDE